MTQLGSTYWDNFATMVVAYAFLALLIERALYQVFDSKAWKTLEGKLTEQTGSDFTDPKPWISAAVSIWIVFLFRLDMIATIFNAKDPQWPSMALTGLFISGGSTGVYKFFKRARQLKDAMAADKLTQSKMPAKQ